MPSINQVTAMGHSARDAEIRYGANGKPVANLTIACTDKFKSGDEWKEVTEWVRVTAFGIMAEQAAHIKKGNLVYVQGKLATRKWKKKDGVEQATTEVVANILVRCEWVKGYAKPETKPEAKPQSRDFDPFDDGPAF